MAKTKDYCIEFKLMYSVALELEQLYGYCLTSYQYDDEVEELLAEHIKDMSLRLAHLVAGMQKTAKLTMNNTEALCFYKLWNRMDISMWPLADVLVRDMVMKIDKRIKEPKRYSYAN